MRTSLKELTLCGWLLLAGGILAEENSPPRRFETSQVHMGASFQLVLYAPDSKTANLGFVQAFRRIAELDQKLSDFDSTSELSRLAAQSPTQNGVPVSDDLWNVLQQADALSQKSDGAFDVTVGNVTRLWRRARRRRQLPDPEKLCQARQTLGFRFVQLQPQTQSIELLRPGMRLDLGGIAKGYAADQALDCLKQLGLGRALVNAGGDIAIGDPPPKRKGWSVAIAPLGARSDARRVLLLSNVAVATSGDAWQFVEIHGIRYSHIVDPLTGLGLTCPSGVTVVAPNCLRADSLASAVSVMGPERGRALVETIPGVECLVLVVDSDQVRTLPSSGFESLATVETK